ncbi:beta family protein [Thiovibrio frasassiensis]|uniref:Beta family protein n=1 Tax=Thiovibrio frasassiensis TaxID=2984131 RepID=A0A9X4MH24_9BACT|nr:hypothetical protein [Thiovibrio frasassiensis]MDG4475393.1 beta family protein [Thiovibrio frasassiensis]
MTNRYIPFLKLKSSEILAIKELSDELKENFVPFFDFPRQKKNTQLAFKSTTEKMVRSMSSHLKENFNFYLDNFDIDSILEIDSINNYAYLLKSFSEFNVIPVVSIDRCAEHLAAVVDAKSSGELSSVVFALRLVPEDFASYDAVADEISDALIEIFALFDSVDLIFDCRVCLGQDLKQLKINIVEFANDFSKDYPLRKLIVAGSSIPASIRDVAGAESEVELTRPELKIYKSVEKEIGQIYDVVLGDYATVSPFYSELDIMPEIMQNVTAPKIIYSFDDQHYIIRGGALKTHQRGFAQYFDLAAVLVSKNFYRSAEYSFGDHYLSEKSLGIGKNVTPSSIVKPTLNAHISYMLKDFF